MYDVIVIGAGPSGSTAAATLAKRGLRVLLAERFALPRYKSCSGILIKKSLDLVRLYFGEGVPSDTTCAPAENRGMVFTGDSGKAVRFEQEGMNIWRGAFDHWLVMKAAQCGAEVRDATSVCACVPQAGSVAVTLRGKKGIYTELVRYVIDCEGVTGAVKRKLFGGPSPLITTFQTFYRGTIDLDPHYFYAYLQPELSEYDAWFNVKDDLLVLGVSAKDPGRIGAYYERFIAHMQERFRLRTEGELRSERWLMPQIRPGCAIDYNFGRVFFAGEIAGFLNPMGEGISAGLESGFCAASAVAEYFDDEKLAAANYRSRTAKLHSYMARQWSLVAGMAAAFGEMALRPHGA